MLMELALRKFAEKHNLQTFSEGETFVVISGELKIELNGKLSLVTPSSKVNLCPEKCELVEENLYVSGKNYELRLVKSVDGKIRYFLNEVK